MTLACLEIASASCLQCFGSWPCMAYKTNALLEFLKHHSKPGEPTQKYAK